MNETSQSLLASDEVVARWHVHLAAQQPGKAGLAVGIIMVALLLTQWTLGAPLLTMAFGMALFSAVADFLLPITYTLRRSGAEMRGWFKQQRIEWKEVRACYRDAAGVKLSPFAHRSRLEPYRGVYLRFNGNREQALEWVKMLAASVGKEHGDNGRGE